MMIFHLLLVCYPLLSVGLSFGTKRNPLLIPLSPLQIAGLYKVTYPNGEERDIDTVFLSKSKLEILEEGRDKSEEFNEEEQKRSSCILCDVVPILVNMKMFPERNGAGLFKRNSILNQDGGFYDFFPIKEVKKELYDHCNTYKGKDFVTPMMKTIVELTGLEAVGLLVEVSDEFLDGKVSLGAGVIMVDGSDPDVIAEYDMRDTGKVMAMSLKAVGKLPSSTKAEVTKTPLQKRFANVLDEKETKMDNRKAMIVKCHLDEMILFSRWLNIPISCPRKLFAKISVDADLSNDPLLISAPLAAQITESVNKVKRSAREEGEDDQDAIVKVWEIFDPKEFISMSNVEKRALLRASGARSLPRPREGAQALDKLLLDLMDSSVRSEVLRLKGSKDETSANIVGDNTGDDRTRLLRAMGEALGEGNIDEAKKLRESFAQKTLLRADPTQDEGSYDPYLDQDDWYYKARVKAMAQNRKKEEKPE